MYSTRLLLVDTVKRRIDMKLASYFSNKNIVSIEDTGLVLLCVAFTINTSFKLGLLHGATDSTADTKSSLHSMACPRNKRSPWFHEKHIIGTNNIL